MQNKQKQKNMENQVKDLIMTQEDKNKMDEIKEYLTIQFQGSSDFVKERIKILLRKLTEKGGKQCQ